MKSSKSGIETLNGVPSERRRVKIWEKGSKAGEEAAVTLDDDILSPGKKVC